ncbi:MAG: hypothetical protein AB1547_12790 [Thermodesulfobacteriota bacterium]
MQLRIGVLAILLLIGLHLAAFAGTITIETQVEATRTDSGLTTRVVLTNQGDETARSITCEVTFQKKTETLPLIEALPPKAPISLTTTHALIEHKAGQYPLIVWVQFHNTNQYPFTALTALIVNVNADALNDLAIEATDMAIDRKGALPFRVKNLAEEDRTITYWLLVPRELSVSNREGRLSLPKRSEQTVSVQLENFAALYGAAYPVYAFFEYDTPEIHRCQMASATVRIALEPSWFQKTRIYWLVAGILVLAVALSCRFLGRKKTVNA